MALGRRIRKLRQAAQLRQDDVAEAARRWGLGWSRTSVGGIEAGVRELSGDELALLAPVLSAACGRRVTLAELCDDDALVRLGSDCRLPLRVVAELLADREVSLDDIDAPHTRPARRLPRAEGRRLRETYGRMWRGSLRDLAEAEAEASGEAEVKAARKWEVPPQWVAVAAARRFGAGLTATRDRRVAEQAGDASPRTRQAVRGHVTRGLLTEIKPLVDQIAEEAAWGRASRNGLTAGARTTQGRRATLSFARWRLAR